MTTLLSFVFPKLKEKCFSIDNLQVEVEIEDERKRVIILSDDASDWSSGGAFHCSESDW